MFPIDGLRALSLHFRQFMPISVLVSDTKYVNSKNKIDFNIEMVPSSYATPLVACEYTPGVTEWLITNRFKQMFHLYASCVLLFCSENVKTLRIHAQRSYCRKLDELNVSALPTYWPW